MVAEPVLRCDHLVKFYDTRAGRVQAVRGVDIELERGVTAAVVGPSGSGKSSLLRMLSGIDRPTAGVIQLDGIDLWRLSDRRRARARSRLLTHVYQRPNDNLFMHLTAEMQLARLVSRRPDKELADDVVASWLERLGLEARRAATPPQMSGGERQRLAFARAAVSGHRIVIADEPTSQLDSASATTVMDAIDVLAEHGVTVLVATHDQRVLERIGSVIALRDGAVATVTTAGEQLSVIDRSGRLQLPPELQSRFPDRRVRLRWGEPGTPVEIEEP
jgi:ABC-type lipoprotein export system ATPase subunit